MIGQKRGKTRVVADREGRPTFGALAKCAPSARLGS